MRNSKRSVKLPFHTEAVKHLSQTLICLSQIEAEESPDGSLMSGDQESV